MVATIPVSVVIPPIIEPFLYAPEWPDHFADLPSDQDDRLFRLMIRAVNDRLFNAAQVLAKMIRERYENCIYEPRQETLDVLNRIKAR